MGNCIAPTSHHDKNGRHRSRSRTSERKEAEELSSAKPAVSCKITEEGVLRVKLVLRKKELEELLSNGLSERATMEDLLVELQAKLCESTAVDTSYEEKWGTAARNSCTHGGWIPSLESIPEDMNISN